MSTDVLMPQMGESIAEGTVVRWIKKVGETVDRDEPLFEISTDKVDAEIPSPQGGVLLQIRTEVGETVPIDTVVAVIGEAGEQVPSAERAPPIPEAVSAAQGGEAAGPLSSGGARRGRPATVMGVIGQASKQ